MSKLPFVVWLEKVDKHLEPLTGIGHEDLPDALWRDWYDDDLSPREAVEAWCEESGEFDEWDYGDEDHIDPDSEIVEFDDTFGL